MASPLLSATMRLPRLLWGKGVNKQHTTYKNKCLLQHSLCTAICKEDLPQLYQQAFTDLIESLLGRCCCCYNLQPLADSLVLLPVVHLALLAAVACLLALAHGALAAHQLKLTRTSQ